MREENSKNILRAQSRTHQLNLRTSSRPGIETQATVIEGECSHLQSDSWGPFFRLTSSEHVFFFRETLIILLIGGATKLLLIQQEERLGSTSQKPSYQRIGTRLSLRSVLAWEGWGNRTSGSLSSPKRPTPCIRLLKTETTVQPLSAATNGKVWWGDFNISNPIAEKKGLILLVFLPIVVLESAFWATIKRTAEVVTAYWVLV